MPDRPISISIRGPVPTKINCPSCSAEIVVPPKPEGPKPIYTVELTCSCNASIFLRCLTHGN